MASSSRNDFDLNEQYGQISLEDEEEGVLIGGEDEGEEILFDDRWCLVGRFITGRTLDFDAMRHMMASLWQPGKGVYIKELGTNRYLFQFYHELDIQSVIDGSPWTFNKCPLVFHRLKKGEDPKAVIHGLRTGFMLDKVVRSAGAYVGGYVKSDPKNFNGLWRDYLRVRATVDIDKLLKRRMKLCKENGDWIWANFQYEYLPTFCFVCGIIGHSERFCPKRFDQPLELVNKPYGIGMKAQMKKKSYLIGAQWLRTEKDDGGVDGGDNVSRRMGDRGGQSIQPRIMEIDRIDPGANCDPMNLGKNKGIMGSNDAIVNKKDISRDQINMAGSEEETINEEDFS
ncbi:hypothetical protein G4B88_011677 [Cannabis sativa]|uniref:CCHC-type domain-containing protein n=1 Tax=Cannabis sativa TaxID=3483 RepID=A0A7J6FRX6_CANSA|nr:hypothetical protein G4B88_011677 [Cannabis sativa]